jgi:hypothetical protein
MRSTLTIGLAALALLAGPAEAEMKKLTGVEIKTAFSGARAYSTVEGGRIFQVDYKPDGTIEGLLEGRVNARQGGRSDTGKWWVDGDTLCRKWSSFGEGKEDCASVALNGTDFSMYRKDGALLISGKLSK